MIPTRRTIFRLLANQSTDWKIDELNKNWPPASSLKSLHGRSQNHSAFRGLFGVWLNSFGFATQFASLWFQCIEARISKALRQNSNLCSWGQVLLELSTALAIDGFRASSPSGKSLLLSSSCKFGLEREIYGSCIAWRYIYGRTSQGKFKAFCR